MKKSTIIIVTIIATILSLVMILLSYFGVTRYISLRIQGPESYISNYKNIPKTDDNTTVAIKTTPDRIKKIVPVISSILDQTVRVDKIFLVIPQNDIDNGYKLPENIGKLVLLFPTGKDYGDECCNSMIPMLLYEKECSTTIIALMDNVVYGKDFIETMITNSKDHPGIALVDSKHTSILAKPEYYECSIINRDKEKYTDEWFLHNSKVVEYNENYKL